MGGIWNFQDRPDAPCSKEKQCLDAVTHPGVLCFDVEGGKSLSFAYFLPLPRQAASETGIIHIDIVGK